MLPKQTPLLVPQLVCPTCLKPMRVEVQKVGAGMISAMVAYCDSEGCRYRHNLQMQYAVGMSDAQYVAPEKKFAIPDAAPKFKVGEATSKLTLGDMANETNRVLDAVVKAGLEKDGAK